MVQKPVSKVVPSKKRSAPVKMSKKDSSDSDDEDDDSSSDSDYALQIILQMYVNIAKKILTYSL